MSMPVQVVPIRCDIARDIFRRSMMEARAVVTAVAFVLIEVIVQRRGIAAEMLTAEIVLDESWSCVRDIGSAHVILSAAALMDNRASMWRMRIDSAAPTVKRRTSTRIAATATILDDTTTLMGH